MEGVPTKILGRATLIKLGNYFETIIGLGFQMIY